MKSRAVPRLLSIVFALGLVTMVARVHAQANSNVQIDAMAIEGTTLTITGKNFGGGPSVTIGDATLVVSRNSDTEIIAVTPALEPGMHVVKVVRDNNAGGSSESTLLIR